MTDKTHSLAIALREAGRLFQRGKPVDMSLIQALVNRWCERMPMDGVRVRVLLAEADAAVVRGDWESVFIHFRAAIQFVCDCDKAARKAREPEKTKGA